MLELREISKLFGARVVLDRVNLGLKAGQHLVLTGPSGAGKSTLLRIIAGLEPAQSGSVTLDGQVATKDGYVVVAPHRRGVSFVFQDLGLWPSLSVTGNVALALSGQKLSRGDRRKRVAESLAAVGLQDFASSSIWQLSGGEQQRLALARALVTRPKLLLLDEPFNGLDLLLKQSIITQLRSLTDSAGTAVILVSHSLEDAALLDAEVAVLEEAGIAERGRAEKLVLQPQSRTMKAWAGNWAGEVYHPLPGMFDHPLQKGTQ